MPPAAFDVAWCDSAHEAEALAELLPLHPQELAERRAARVRWVGWRIWPDECQIPDAAGKPSGRMGSCIVRDRFGSNLLQPGRMRTDTATGARSLALWENVAAVEVRNPGLVFVRLDPAWFESERFRKAEADDRKAWAFAAQAYGQRQLQYADAVGESLVRYYKALCTLAGIAIPEPCPQDRLEDLANAAVLTLPQERIPPLTDWLTLTAGPQAAASEAPLPELKNPFQYARAGKAGFVDRQNRENGKPPQPQAGKRWAKAKL